MTIMTLTGPSAVGKSTLAKMLPIPEAISHTTRHARDGEIDGREMHFVDDPAFNEIEFVETTAYRGNRYGLSRAELTQADDVVAVVDRDGRDQIHQAFDDVVRVLVQPTDIHELKSRLLRRYDGVYVKVQQRLEGVEDEIKDDGRFDLVVVNDDLDETLEQLKGALEY